MNSILSSTDPFDDPKCETLSELFRRIHGGRIGIVRTAFIADATPAELVSHTRSRGRYQEIIDSYLHGVTNYSWTKMDGVDGGDCSFYLSNIDQWLTCMTQCCSVVVLRTSSPPDL